MNLYLLEQDINGGYNTYDSAVVAAESEDEARMIYPSPYVIDWDGKCDMGGAWCNKEDVKVKLIGYAINESKSGLILSSFNAG